VIKRPAPGPLRRYWPLDPGVVFLNHGSFGACPRPVLAAQEELRARLEAEPVRFFSRDYPDLLEATRRRAAVFLGCDPAALVFVPNATTGVNTVLRSLAMPGPGGTDPWLRPGDGVLVLDHVYPACRNAVTWLAERCGLRVREARVPFPLADPGAAVDAILSAVTGETRLVLLDQVTSPTGMVLPAEEIVRPLEDRGIPVLVDGAHAPGMVDLDLDRLGASFWTGNAHKWLCTPKGAAFLVVAERWRDRVFPGTISHGWARRRPGQSRFHALFEWTGTDDPTAVLSIPAALDFLGGLVAGGIAGLRARNRTLALRAREILCEALGTAPPCPGSMVGSLAAVRLPDGLPAPDAATAPHLDPLHDALFERYGIEVPVISWPDDATRWIRIAAQAYNHVDEYRYLAAALDELRHRRHP